VDGELEKCELEKALQFGGGSGGALAPSPNAPVEMGVPPIISHHGSIWECRSVEPSSPNLILFIDSPAIYHTQEMGGIKLIDQFFGIVVL
jgi:hypothetical protein